MIQKRLNILTNLLKQKIIERIKSEGHINFETFMEMALYHPELGYYTKDSTMMGRGFLYKPPSSLNIRSNDREADGETVGLKTIGFCPQGAFLVSLGIDQVMMELYGDSLNAFEIAKIKGLILPQGMGESHKVMVQYKGKDNLRLSGFALRNQIGRL